MMEKLLKIPVGSIQLEGMLAVPDGAKGLVIFAHGAGSSRLSPRNNFVAEELQKVGLGTLLFDLLTEEEDEIYENRFDIPLLADRLKIVTDWIKKQPETKNLNIGYFGASTGAAAATISAADIGAEIKAVVSRGGRPDLAGEALPKIQSPTLLIVGGNDDVVIGLNEDAHSQMKCKKKMNIIPGTTHLFEEPGTLEEAAHQAADWFKEYLA